jgi:hypothetical protein
LAVVDEALIDGRISWDHARVLTDAIIDLLDQDGGHDPADGLTRNQLRLSNTLAATVELPGRLVGEQALVAKAAIEARADELFRRFSADHEHCAEIEVPDRACLRALGFVELCRAGQAVDLASTKAPRPDVTLAVNAQHPTSGATDVDGVRLADESTRVLLCDPDLHPIVVDSLGVPLDLGRSVRYATTAQRRALAHRDGGCVFPGCSAPPAWLDVHHLRGFHAERGSTDLANLAGVCRHHHGVTHRRGWTMHTSPDGWYWWQTPTGHTFWSQRHGRQRPGPAPPPRQ